VRLAQASGNGIATRVLLRPAQRFAVASNSNAFLNAVSVNGVRQARGAALAQSTAYQTEIFFGRQHPAGGGGNALAYGAVGGTTVNGMASSSAIATASAETATQHYADASGAGAALYGSATTGNQSFAVVAGVGVAGASVTETFNPGARGFATAAGFVVPADFQRADAGSSARALAEPAQTGAQFYADATATAFADAAVDGTFNPGAFGSASGAGSAVTAEFQRATAYGLAASGLSDAEPGEQVFADAMGAAASFGTVGTPLHNYAARAVGQGVASFVGSQFGTQVFADAMGALSSATAVVFETFNPGARGSASASGVAPPAEFQRASADGTAAASLSNADPGTQFYADASGAAAAIASATGTFNPGARGFAAASSQAKPAEFVRAFATGAAGATLVASRFGTQNMSAATGSAAVTSQPIQTWLNLAATASGALAQATAVFINPRAISDEPAPDERQMSVSGDDRGMLVPGEDRIMVVSA